MPSTLTPQQSLAMGYARLQGLRGDLDDADPSGIEALCAHYHRALEDLQAAGFDLSAFRLDDEELTEDRDARLRARLDALLDYMDLFAGLP
jgi:hypothetical protein